MEKKSEIEEILEFWEKNEEELTEEEVTLFYPGAWAVQHKIKKFQIPIVVPTYLYEIIGLNSRGNPAMAIMMFSDILAKLAEEKKISSGYKIKIEDFKKVFPEHVPDFNIEEDNNLYHMKWNRQKNYELPESDNEVDYDDYWLKFFVEVPDEQS